MLKSLWIIMLFVPSMLCAAEDWPHWTGPESRNVSAETDLVESFDRKTLANVRWVTRLGEMAFGAPTISNGRVFVGTNMASVREDKRFRGIRGGVVACLDEVTGERIWNLTCPERTWGFPKKTHMEDQRWGICSSPTVDGDRIYVVTNGGDLVCLDVEGLANGNDGPFQDEGQFMAGEGNEPVALLESDADIIWHYDIPRELDVAPHDVASSSVLVDGNVLYLTTSNGIGRGSPVYAVKRDAPAFIAVDKRTGKFLAREEVVLSRNLFHAQWGSAIKAEVNDRKLIVLGGNDGFCYAFELIVDVEHADPVLKMVWKYDCVPQHYRQYPNGKEIYYYQGDLRVYKRKAKLNKEIAAFIKDNPKKKQVGKFIDLEPFNNGDGSFVGPSEILASPVVYEDRVYVAIGRDPLHGMGRGVLSCFKATGEGDVSDSAEVWSFEGIGRSMSTVAVADGLVYAGDLAGNFYCLDAITGELVWQEKTGNEIWGSPVVADGKVYLNTQNSFWIFKAGRVRKVLHMSRGGSECGPVVANGVVYAYIRGQLFSLQKNLDRVNDSLAN